MKVIIKALHAHYISVKQEKKVIMSQNTSHKLNMADPSSNSLMTN